MSSSAVKSTLRSGKCVALFKLPEGQWQIGCKAGAGLAAWCALPIAACTQSSAWVMSSFSRADLVCFTALLPPA